jgi:hypothetical protein
MKISSQQGFGNMTNIYHNSDIQVVGLNSNILHYITVQEKCLRLGSFEKRRKKITFSVMNLESEYLFYFAFPG